METGLKATIMPELDQAKMEEFMAQFTSQMSGLTIPVGTSGDGSTAGATSSLGFGTGNNSSASSAKDNNAEAVAQGVQEGMKKTSQENPEVAEKNTQGTKDALSNVTSKLGSVGKTTSKGLSGILGGIGKAVPQVMAVLAIVTLIYELTFGFIKRIQNASPALQTVMNLIDTGVNMILMPIGTILAVKLMPTVQAIFTKLGAWMSKAWDIYDQDGWAGLLKECMHVALDIFWEVVQGAWNNFGAVIGEIFWELLGHTVIGQMLHQFFPTWDSLANHFNNFCHDVGEWFGSVFGEVNINWEDVWYNLSHPLEFVGSLISKLKDWWDNIDWSGLLSDLGNMLADIFGGLLDVGGDIVDSVKGGWNDTIGSWTGLKFADGGIATGPTIGMFGEAGPEAIIPLSEINNVMSSVSNSPTSNISTGGSTTINFYITGSNAGEISEEVQHQLEKSAGKAYSKTKWW